MSMVRFRKFMNLPAAERSLLLRVAGLLWLIRLGLWLLPFQTLQRLHRRVAHVSPPRDKAGTIGPDRLAWAVTVASRYVPGATCLTQALAAQVLLGRRGHQTRLHIGVRKGEESDLQAHAWLECSGRVVIGESNVECYSPLLRY
jgi:hypothetical protein